MNQCDPTFDPKLNVGHSDLPVILPYILKTVCWMNIKVWITSQCDPNFDLKINVGRIDLYFMVQWFCLIYIEDYMYLMDKH